MHLHRTLSFVKSSMQILGLRVSGSKPRSDPPLERPLLLPLKQYWSTHWFAVGNILSVGNFATF